MKRKIRLSALVAVLVLMLALLIGGLYGTFDDEETSIGNVFTAGTLNLISEISGSNFTDNVNVVVNEMGDGINDNVTFGQVLPGDNGTISWTLTNSGTVDGSLALVSTVVGSENGLNEPEGLVDDIGDGTGELDDLILCTLYLDGSDISGGEISLAAMEAFLNDTVLLDAGQTVVYRLDWRINNVATGNELQSDTAEINITFTLTQV
jgi:hypothetical protein